VGLLLAANVASDDPPTVGGGDMCCGDEYPPVFLHSKIDDDNADGNPVDDYFPRYDLEDDDIADHTWIRDKTGAYHLYFHDEGKFGPAVIHHYVTTDLRRLDYIGVALSPQPGTWEQDGVWAPNVVEHGGLYYMFYTGTDGIFLLRQERIGLAVSDNLVTWERVPSRCAVTGEGCIYECRESWTTWDRPPGSNNQQCRDPFVMWDDTHDVWLMLVTARSSNGYGVISAAVSPDLLAWRGSGFIDATRRLDAEDVPQSTGGIAENAFVFNRAGTNYLFFTDWRDTEDSLSTATPPRTMAQWATSATLDFDSLGSADWIYRGYFTDPGVNAIEVMSIPCGGEMMWLLSGSMANKDSGWALEHRRHLRLKCFRWLPDGRFETTNPRLP
jgi:hypothetical protein